MCLHTRPQRAFIRAPNAPSYAPPTHPHVLLFSARRLGTRHDAPRPFVLRRNMMSSLASHPRLVICQCSTSSPLPHLRSKHKAMRPRDTVRAYIILFVRVSDCPSYLHSTSISRHCVAAPSPHLSTRVGCDTRVCGETPCRWPVVYIQLRRRASPSRLIPGRICPTPANPRV